MQICSGPSDLALEREGGQGMRPLWIVVGKPIPGVSTDPASYEPSMAVCHAWEPASSETPGPASLSPPALQAWIEDSVLCITDEN